MAKITVFECDICKKQGKKIQEVKMTVTPLLLVNGEGKANAGAPSEATFQVCAESCLIEGIKKAFKKMSPETVSVEEALPLDTEVV